METKIINDYNMENLVDFGFEKAGNTGWIKEIADDIFIAIDKPTRCILLVTEHGSTPLRKANKNMIIDLYNADIIECEKDSYDYLIRDSVIDLNREAEKIGYLSSRKHDFLRKW